MNNEFTSLIIGTSVGLVAFAAILLRMRWEDRKRARAKRLSDTPRLPFDGPASSTQDGGLTTR
jgi:hypothetical protein